jgi:hypothetical protein
MDPLHILIYTVYCQITLIVKGKGKEISGHALRVPGGWAPGGKIVSPTHRLPLHPRKHSLYSFPLEVISAAGKIMSM